MSINANECQCQFPKMHLCTYLPMALLGLVVDTCLYVGTAAPQQVQRLVEWPTSPKAVGLFIIGALCFAGLASAMLVRFAEVVQPGCSRAQQLDILPNVASNQTVEHQSTLLNTSIKQAILVPVTKRDDTSRAVLQRRSVFATVVSNISEFGFYSGCVTNAVSIRRLSSLPVILVVEGTLLDHRRTLLSKYFDEILEMPLFIQEYPGVNHIEEAKTRFQGAFVKLYLWALARLAAAGARASRCPCWTARACNARQQKSTFPTWI